MKIYQFTIGTFAVNNYLVQAETSNKAILIDAGEAPQPILDKIHSLGLELVYLVNTHGHGDHIAGNAIIVRETGAQLLIHPLDEPYLTDPTLNLSAFLGAQLQSPPADGHLEEGDELVVDDIRLHILHTPGHTPGHITLVGDNLAFVGDVIFYEGIGRTDFPRSDHEQLITTIRTKIYTLPEGTQLLPGHGPATTVAHEKQHNPFVRG